MEFMHQKKNVFILLPKLNRWFLGDVLPRNVFKPISIAEINDYNRVLFDNISNDF